MGRALPVFQEKHRAAEQTCIFRKRGNGWNRGKGIQRNPRDFFAEEDGMGTVEVILIIVVLIGLVIIFKTQITKLVKSIFQSITEDAGEVTN